MAKGARTLAEATRLATDVVEGCAFADMSPVNVQTADAHGQCAVFGSAVAKDGATAGASHDGCDDVVGIHEVVEATDRQGCHSVFGPTDGYSYTELLNTWFVEHVCTVVMCGIIIVTVDSYETVNAVGSDGSYPTTEDGCCVFTLTKHTTFLRAFVSFDEQVGVATIVVDTQVPPVEYLGDAPGSGETTSSLGAPTVDFEIRVCTDVVNQMLLKQADGYVLSAVGKDSNVHVVVGTTVDYELMTFEEVSDKSLCGTHATSCEGMRSYDSVNSLLTSSENFVCVCCRRPVIDDCVFLDVSVIGTTDNVRCAVTEVGTDFAAVTLTVLSLMVEVPGSDYGRCDLYESCGVTVLGKCVDSSASNDSMPVMVLY